MSKLKWFKNIAGEPLPNESVTVVVAHINKNGAFYYDIAFIDCQQWYYANTEDEMEDTPDYWAYFNNPIAK